MSAHGNRHGVGWKTRRQPYARLTAILPARAESLGELHAAFDLFFSAAEGAGATIRPVDRIALVKAAAEVAASIVDHACPGMPDAQMSIALECDGSVLEARFEDSGRPYDPAAEPHLDRPRDAGPHLGIGLGVAQDSVDELEYARQGGRNCWRLVRRTPTGAPPGRDFGAPVALRRGDPGIRAG